MCGGRHSDAEQCGAERRGQDRKRGTDEERDVVAAGQGNERAVAVSTQTVGPRGGNAGQHCEAKRAAHHERRVDDPGGEAGLARLDIAHRGQQNRAEGHAGTDSEQDHAREHIDKEAPVNRCPHEE